MQNYSTDASRNTIRAASGSTDNAGTLPGKVSVPFPEGANKPAPSGASKPKAPSGFDNGLINGKV